MKSIALVILSAVFGYASAASLVIENVNIVATRDGQVVPGMHVLIEDNLIKQVRKRPFLDTTGARVIDGSDKFLIPGLIDSHVHLAKVPGMNGRHKQAHPQLVQSYLTQQPRSYLYYGYTTLVDLNVFSSQLIDDFNNAPLHPDVFTCSKHLDIANGHGMFEEDPKTRLRDNPNFLYDHYQNQTLQGDFDLAKHTPEVTVKAIKDAQAVCIKTYYENGYGGSEMADYDIPSPEIIRDVVIEGRKLNLPTVLHGNSWESYRFALLADVDIIGHGLWHWGEYRHAVEVPLAIRTTLKEMSDRQMGYQPTMHVLGSQRGLFDPGYLGNPDVAKAYPVELIAWYESEEGKWFQSYIRKYLPSHTRDYDHPTLYKLFDRYLTHTGKALKVMADYDANLLLATDTIIGQSYANAPGFSGYEEMLAWDRFGVPLDKILKAATINNAEAFNLADRYGTVEQGKVANLLLLNSNPLESIQAYNEIELVVLRGKAIQRASLSAVHAQ